MNDITPDVKSWAPFREGLEIQIVVPNPILRTTATALPGVVWFRKPTKQKIALSSLGPAFDPHGALLFVNQDGVNFLEGHGVKKHVKDDITGKPGEQRGLACDVLLQQQCPRWRAAKRTAGECTVSFGTSNQRRVTVVE